MKNASSERIQILKRVLRDLYSNDFREIGEQIVFGTDCEIIAHGLKTPSNGRYKELVDSEIQRFYAGRLSLERTSLEAIPDLDALLQCLDAIPQPEGSEFAARYASFWKELLTSGPPKKEDSSVLSEPQSELLEQYYAEEMIAKLPEMVSRATSLQKLDLEQIPKIDLREYFEEAHKCYLQGFTIACAVMCRAILESALEERLDPEKQLPPWKPSSQVRAWGRAKSDILRQLDQAQAMGILDGSRVEAGEAVKDAGDAALHNLELFRARWNTNGSLRDLIDDTRRVIEDLYRSTPT